MQTTVYDVTLICPPSPPTNISVELFISSTLAAPGDLLVFGGGFWVVLISLTVNEPMFPNLRVTKNCKKNTFRIASQSTCAHMFRTQPPSTSPHVHCNSPQLVFPHLVLSTQPPIYSPKSCRVFFYITHLIMWKQLLIMN